MLSCFDYALGYLSRYPKTVFEMRKQLQKKGYEDEEAEETLSILVAKGYLDDKNYAYLYLQSEGVKKGKPLFVVKQKLQQKGVEHNILEDLIEELGEELKEGITKKLSKEIGNMREKGMEEQKIIQRLQRRGYRYGEIEEIMRKG